jgi:glycolate oxidase iron-sulfur subunit
MTNVFDSVVPIQMADDEDMYKCVHCGLCLSVCPTYVQTGLETESPRGRIHFMKSVSEGKLILDDQVISHWDMCLQCRACEAVCPSGVPYGSLITSVKNNINLQGMTSPKTKRLSLVLLRGMLPHLNRLKLIAQLSIFYKKSKLSYVFNKIGVFKILPTELRQMERQLPNFTKPFFTPRRTSYLPQDGVVNHKIALLSGCIMPLVQSDAMRSTVRVLNKNHCEVIVPIGQGCCGALNLHTGDLEYAKKMARINIDIMLESSPDYILTNSAGCGASMKEYEKLFSDDVEYSAKAQLFSRKTMDIHEFLIKIGLKIPEKEFKFKVTYQDACHLAHGQRITSQPREILKSIKGLEFIEMDNSAMCCGSAGIYSMLNPSMAQDILSDKLDNIISTHCDIVATSNPGCSMHIGAGLEKNNLPYRIMHVIEILDQAYL